MNPVARPPDLTESCRCTAVHILVTGRVQGVGGVAKICEQCDRRAVARGLCSAHYQQWRYRAKKAKVRDVRAIVPGAVLGSVLGKVPSAANTVIDDNGERHELNA